MKNPHTLLLINEAFDKILEFTHKRYIDELVNISKIPQKATLSAQKHLLNQILEKFGLHLMYKSVFKELENNSYSKMGKWSAIGTLRLALVNPDEFDKVYNLFSDEESKATFDWFIKYRVAYAFLGELAGEIFPPKITKDEFFKRIKSLEVKRNGLINMQDFCFKSEVLETAQAWIFKQYELDKKCGISEGDYIIDGGAFKGETAFWFLSKGGGKVYAFEPDPHNFSVLLENIKRNKVEDKIIPVQKVLSNEVKTISMYTIGSGRTTALEGGNKTVQSVTLDSFVEEEKLERVDFIKLDVEGSELKVLQGAIETIKKFKPKMAISIYHKPEDLISIPNFLSHILPSSGFYLSHKSYELSETILFVVPRK